MLEKLLVSAGLASDSAAAWSKVLKPPALW
jgi:hypothetical protein